MKKKLMMFVTSIVTLSSCSHFRSDPSVSVWAEGGWLVFWVPFIGSLIFLVLAYMQQKKGDWVVENGATTNRTASNKPITNRWRFKAFIALQIFSWGVVWYFNSNYWR